ncbi:hypothetical protein EXIGLDRAFT_629312 [Exidia glandulosa HHB12029]|uniref:DUF6589 domain-containing protein n=1 Tax=Exidia glandulosa HHB12029 TaxID=1314781 RepID=A0A165ZAR5_EXIGL|nr:hypothetical protein EXIGLDRAFT_629312 [Exidia glandulosa HHB12029]
MSVPSATSPKPPTLRRAPALTDTEKLDELFYLLKRFGWSLGVTLDKLFRRQADGGLSWSDRHNVIVPKFLSGQATHTASEIVQHMYSNSSSRPASSSAESRLEFSLDVPHGSIKHARPALSSWAASICREKVWKDISNGVVETVQDVLQGECALLWGLMVAAGKKSLREGEVRAVRVYRPVEPVVTGAISSLMFCRNKSANLLQLCRGLGLFASRAEESTYRVGSKFGQNSSYSTVISALETLAESGQDWLRSLAASEVEWLMFIIDNVQHYGRQRDARFGREDIMFKGVAGTGVKLSGATILAWALNRWNDLRRKELRYSLTASDLPHRVDFNWLETTYQLNWVDVLLLAIPELDHLKSELEHRFVSNTKQPVLPDDYHTPIQPLRSNACDPAKTTEMRTALLDIFAMQLGQTAENWQPRVVFVGGDGGTYEMLLRVQKYLQTLPTAYERMEWLVPILQLWHMKWTVLGRIIFCWWGSSRTSDVSSLGNSAIAAGKKVPSKLKKPDFRSGTEMLFLVGEARMLDCWRITLKTDDLHAHFATLKAEDRLPTLNELLLHALMLHRTYSSRKSSHLALEPYETQPAAYRAPRAVGWMPQVHPGPSASKASGSKPSRRKGAAAAPETTMEDESTSTTVFEEELGFSGDRWLANSITGMSDFIPYRHWCKATPVGWIGDIWEIFKLQTFGFAGSGHNPKYLSFCLEMIMLIEFEAEPDMRLALLQSLLVNPSGRKGRCKEGDLMQEHQINRLDRQMQNKDKTYDSRFIRDVVSPNLDSLVDLPRQLELAVDLQARSTTHTRMHQRPETKLLLKAYTTAQLHTFHTGRSSGFAVKDCVGEGIRNLEAGGLSKFLSTHRRETDVLNRATPASHSHRAQSNPDPSTSTSLGDIEDLLSGPTYTLDDELGPPADRPGPAIYADEDGMILDEDGMEEDLEGAGLGVEEYSDGELEGEDYDEDEATMYD